MEILLDKLGIEDYDIAADAGRFSYHPGRCAPAFRRRGNARRARRIAPRGGGKLRHFRAGLQLHTDVDLLFQNAKLERQYRPLPKFPAVTRDLALLCDDDIPVLTLERAIAKAAGSLLEGIKLFDVYKGAQIAEGKKSVAFSITLRSAESTLTEEQVSAAIKRVMKALEAAGAVLRS